MKRRTCKDSYHLSLKQDLCLESICPTRGRNYEEEDFLEACAGLKIDPELVTGKRKGVVRDG